MKHKMFSVHDVKAGAYFPPWFLHQVGMAIRCFSDCVNDPEHNFGRHPADYTLFEIGEFDDSTGRVEAMVPESRGNGVDFLNAVVVEPDDLFDPRKADGSSKDIRSSS